MLLTIVAFILILSVLVFVHELGHYWTARKFGAEAEEFGFGFPPRLFGWKKVNGKRKFFWGNKKVESEDTIWSMNWIPIGGFVQIKGQDGEEENDPKSFASKKPWQRTIILSAGVIMNVVLTAICLMIVFMLGAPQVIDKDTTAEVSDRKIQVMTILEESPALDVGIKVGDVIVSIDGNNFENIEQLQAYLASNENDEVLINITRLDEEIEYNVTLKYLDEIGSKSIGVGLVNTGTVSYPWYKAIWLGLKGTVVMFVQIIVAFYTVIKNAIIGVETGVEIAGPVGIAVITGQMARMGVSYILQFTALLSMNLAIINFLPFPALDGGRVLFIIIEKLRGKPNNQKVEQVVHTIGFILLIVLILVVTGKDIWKYAIG